MQREIPVNRPLGDSHATVTAMSVALRRSITAGRGHIIPAAKEPLKLNRKIKETILREQARVTDFPRGSWAPEIVGILLLTFAVLTTAGFFD